MAVSAEFQGHVLDQLEGLGSVTAKPMFGGAGLYLEGTMFGLITRRGVLYFRTDDANRSDYEAARMGPFMPYADRPTRMPYHEVPAAVMEDADAMCAWARRAWEAGRRGRRRGKGGRR